MQRFSLAGLIKHVVTISGRYFVRARKIRANFRGSKLPETVTLPGLALLPVPVQKLVAEEFGEAHRLVQQDEPLRPGLGLSQAWDEDEEEDTNDVALVEIACGCRFFCAWRLPCRHVLHHHLQFSSLCRMDIWHDWTCKWEDSGFKIYEAYKSFRSGQREIAELVAAAERLAAREAIDELQNDYYTLEQQALQQLGPVDGREFIGWQIKKLQAAAASMNGMDLMPGAQRRLIRM